MVNIFNLTVHKSSEFIVFALPPDLTGYEFLLAGHDLYLLLVYKVCFGYQFE